MDIIVRPIQDSSTWRLPATIPDLAAPTSTVMLDEVKKWGLISRYGDSRTFTVVELLDGSVRYVQHKDQSREFEYFWRRISKKLNQPGGHLLHFGEESVAWTER